MTAKSALFFFLLKRGRARWRLRARLKILKKGHNNMVCYILTYLHIYVCFFFFLVPFEKPSFLFCVPIIFTASSSILQSRSTAKVATATRGIKARKCVLELQLLALTVLISQLLPLSMFLFFLLSLVYMKHDTFIVHVLHISFRADATLN